MMLPSIDEISWPTCETGDYSKEDVIKTLLGRPFFADMCWGGESMLEHNAQILKGITYLWAKWQGRCLFPLNDNAIPTARRRELIALWDSSIITAQAYVGPEILNTSSSPHHLGKFVDKCRSILDRAIFRAKIDLVQLDEEEGPRFAEHKESMVKCFEVFDWLRHHINSIVQIMMRSEDWQSMERGQRLKIERLWSDEVSKAQAQNRPMKKPDTWTPMWTKAIMTNYMDMFSAVTEFHGRLSDIIYEKTTNVDN